MTTEQPSQAQLAQQMSDLLTRFQTFTKQQKEWLAGTPSGGPEGDGRYPLTDYLGTTYLVPCPALDSARVKGEVDSAKDYAAQASAAMASSQTFLTQSSLARDLANDFAQAALASRDLSQMYADQAGTHAANARAYAQDAAASAELAKVDLQALADSVAGASASAQASANSAASASASEAHAATSAAAAATSAAQADTFNPANFAPIGGVNDGFRIGGVAVVGGGSTIVQAPSATGNAHLWLADSTNKSRVLFVWDNASDLATIRKYDAGGNYKDVSVDNDGSITVPGAGNFGSQLYSAHQYPLIEFRQPGTPTSQGEGFVGSWGGQTLIRSWPSGIDHSKFLELSVGQQLGSMRLLDHGGNVYFKADNQGAATVSGPAAAWNFIARDGLGTWSAYAVGNRYRIWNSQSGDVLSVGAGGDAYIGMGGGGSLQIGDDALIRDVNVAHTLGLRSTSNGNVGFLQFGTGPGFGYDGYNLLWNGRPVGPSVNVGTDDISAVPGGHYICNMPGGTTHNTPTGGWTTMMNAINFDNTWGFQLSHGWFEDDLWYRRKYNGGYDQPWRKLWHSGNLVVSSGDPGAADGRIWIQI
ncbi:hypothetical protein [Stenotrophomonas sp. SAU14A_NAIMI4_8]|uniref:hypothetical protein n=1 Tax=Stenotrophomonas sp. SAU14A_NAIMI4_8 TaxID=2072409 RepID=UPI000D53E207|nr:hypothetical protein [Stenotrophomonas sp. SAU14A_NAIMI4_8]AWH32233.1 hypothetical protein C1930_04780 [Stenotrophomonas sp. SAU14A_NAIMI4_8]